MSQAIAESLQKALRSADDSAAVIARLSAGDTPQTKGKEVVEEEEDDEEEQQHHRDPHEGQGHVPRSSAEAHDGAKTSSKISRERALDLLTKAHRQQDPSIKKSLLQKVVVHSTAASESDPHCAVSVKEKAETIMVLLKLSRLVFRYGPFNSFLSEKPSA